MDNAALFRVRTEAAERVRQAMEKHKLPKDSMGGYRYNDAVTFIENVEGVLEDEYFENANDGMRGLVNLLPNELTSFKANVAITRADVKRQSIADAPGGDATKAEITSNEDAQEEANQRLPSGVHRRQGEHGQGNYSQGRKQHHKHHPASPGRHQNEEGG